MLFGLFVALSLTSAQDSCVIDSNNIYMSAYHVACAGDLDSWEDVLNFRHIANKEGFGSVTRLRPDSAYALSFILFGDSSTVHSQWIRLNALIGFKSNLRRPTYGEVRPVAKTSLSRNVAKRLKANLNVSAWNQRVLTIRPPQAPKKEIYLNLADTTAIVKTEVDSINDGGPSEGVFKSALQPINSGLPSKDSAVSLVPIETKALLGQNTDSIEFKSVVDTTGAIASQNNLSKQPPEDTNEELVIKKKSVVLAKKTLSDSSEYSKSEMYRTVSEDSGRLNISDKHLGRIERGTYYLIVFGSYGDRETAALHRNRLKSDGLEVEIKPNKNNFRVVIFFDYYPSKELEKYRISHPPCWVATINHKQSGIKIR